MDRLALLKVIRRFKKKEFSLSQRILIGLISFGFILLTAFIVYLLWYSLTGARVADVLPAKKTTAYIEINDLSLPPKINREGLLQTDLFKNTLKNLGSIDYQKALQEWMRPPIGIALIEVENNGNQAIIFARVQNRRKALSFLDDLGLGEETLEKEEINGYPVYSFPQGQTFNFTFIKSYIFVAQEKGTLKSLIQAQGKNKLHLAEDEEFQASFANLPSMTWAKFYINIQNISFKDYDPLRQIIEPLKYMVNHFALTVRKDNNGFHFNHYLNLKSESTSEQKGYSESTSFAYSLTDYIGSENLVAYIGGANLTNEWINTLKTISSLNPSYGIILEGIIRAQVNKMFGRNVDLRNDIYPLFEGEYAFAINKNNNEIGTKLILSHNYPDFVQAKMEKLYKGFRLLAAQFTPKLEVFILPDGTESKELIADPSSVNESKDEHEGYEIHCVEIKDSVYGFCYTVTDKLLVMANQKNLIEETIDLTLSPKFTLSQSQSFRKTLSNFSKVSDEITFINLENLALLLKNGQFNVWAESILKPFEAITWVKHYFDDGVSSEGYLLLK